jgi:hypothetical protein
MAKQHSDEEYPVYHTTAQFFQHRIGNAFSKV